MKKYFLFILTFINFAVFYSYTAHSSITPIDQTSYGSPARSNAPARAAQEVDDGGFEQTCDYSIHVYLYGEDLTNNPDVVPSISEISCCTHYYDNGAKYFHKCNIPECDFSTDNYVQATSGYTELNCGNFYGESEREQEFCIRNNNLQPFCRMSSNFYMDCGSDASASYSETLAEENENYGLCAFECGKEKTNPDSMNTRKCRGFQIYQDDQICEKIVENDSGNGFLWVSPLDSVIYNREEEYNLSPGKDCALASNKSMSSVKKACIGYYSAATCFKLDGKPDLATECPVTQEINQNNWVDSLLYGRHAYKCNCRPKYQLSADIEAIYGNVIYYNADVCDLECGSSTEIHLCRKYNLENSYCPEDFKTLSEWKQELGEGTILDGMPNITSICKIGCSDLDNDNGDWKYNRFALKCYGDYMSREFIRTEWGFTDRFLDKFEEDGKRLCKADCQPGDDRKTCTKYYVPDLFPECPTSSNPITYTDDGAEIQYINTSDDDGYEGYAPSVIRIASGPLAGWYTTSLSLTDDKIIDRQKFLCTDPGSQSLYEYKKGANLTDANGYLFLEKSEIINAQHCNGVNNFKSDANTLPIVGIRLYSECKCPNHVLKSVLCNNNQTCIEQGIGDPYDICTIAFKSNNEKVIGYKQVSCPNDFYTLSEYWNANKNSMTFDAFLERELRISFIDDWKNYYTAITSDPTYKCEYGAKWDQAQGKPQPTETKYNKFMLNCGIIQDKFQDIELQTEKPTTQNYVTCVEKTIDGDKTKEETKYIPVCTIDHKAETYLGYETFTKTNPDPSICTFNNKTYYRNGGSCPIKFTGSEAIIEFGLSSTDLQTLYGPNIVDRTCDYYGEKRTLITCDAKTYTARCVYPYIVNGYISQSYCRRAKNGEQISLDSPMYYDNSGGNACIFEPSTCGVEINSETPGEPTEFRYPVASASSCTKLYGPAAKGEQCITSGGELTYQCYWSKNFNITSCPIGSDMTRPYIIENGVKKWDSCHCAIAYKYHKLNCDGLRGASCHQSGKLSAEFLAERNDPTLNTFSENVDFYTHCDQPLDENGEPIVITPPPADDEENGGNSGSGSGSGDSGSGDPGSGDSGSGSGSGDSGSGDSGSGSGDSGSGSGDSGSGSGSGNGSGSGSTSQKTYAVCYYCCPSGMKASGKTIKVNGAKKYECVYK